MKRALTLAACLVLSTCGQADVAETAPAPAVPTATPAPIVEAVPRVFDPSRFPERCIAVASRKQTDPAVLAADRRICECMGRTLKPADLDTLLNFMEIDPERPDYNRRVAELYQNYGMSENQFATELNRIRAAGRSCR